MARSLCNYTIITPYYDITDNQCIVYKSISNVDTESRIGLDPSVGTGGWVVGRLGRLVCLIRVSLDSRGAATWSCRSRVPPVDRVPPPPHLPHNPIPLGEVERVHAK